MSESPTSVPPAMSTDQRKAILQTEINRLVSRGYIVTSQTDSTAQLTKENSISFYLEVKENGSLYRNNKPAAGYDYDNRPGTITIAGVKIDYGTAIGGTLIVFAIVISVFCVLCSAAVASISSMGASFSHSATATVLAKTPTRTPQPTATATVTRTPFPTWTPRPSLTPRPSNTPRPTTDPAVTAYFNKALPPIKQLGSALQELQVLMLSPKIGDSDWSLRVVVQASLIQNAHTQLKAITPPSVLANAHYTLISGSQDCSTAMDRLLSGLDTNNASLINSATDLIISCGNKVSDATLKFQAFQP